ncbi:MAG TPA: beta-ketoacyl synthase N-terminal-like domain-containing protein, partial [Candidatus Binatia bacterium]|nr:beta-ketoacyl synthase N-terminal-like domain-containing protein [Candidatus Binatia bacterium]
ELYAQAASAALAASPIQEIDALYLGAMNPEEFTGDSNIAAQVVEALGISGIPALRIETASSAGAAAIHAAWHAVASGYHRSVLVLGGEKMTHLSTSAATRILAEVIDAQERRCGATMPALAAMITERYRQRYRLSTASLEAALCAVAMKNHGNGAHNAFAQFQKPITKEIYLASKLVSTPLRLYDCSPMTDGAAAVLLTGEKTDLKISGLGQGTGPAGLRERDTFTSFEATRIAAERAYRMAGVTARDMDFAEVHDAFTSFEIISTEDLGFFPAGKGWQAVQEGKTAPDGALPINVSGGLKARGHPVGASGLAQVVEVVRLMRGEGGLKLKRYPRRALAQSTGGLGANNFVTIVERADGASPNSRPPSPPELRPVKRRAGAAPVRSQEGTIETFTILYVTPDGFLPPLALALIRGRAGELIMAQGEDVAHLKIGREVFLRELDGGYIFTVKSHLDQVKDALERLIRSLPRGKETRATKAGER